MECDALLYAVLNITGKVLICDINLAIKAMTPAAENIAYTRRTLLELVKQLSLEQLNQIPAGFNNNIIWNLGHLVATQQRICYTRANLPPVVDEVFVAAFQKGTKPEKYYTAEDYNHIHELLFSTLDILSVDHGRGIFAGYTPWVTPYGNEIINIDDALNFLPFHEGLHYGYVMALKRMILSR